MKKYYDSISLCVWILLVLFSFWCFQAQRNMGARMAWLEGEYKSTLFELFECANNLVDGSAEVDIIDRIIPLITDSGDLPESAELMDRAYFHARLYVLHRKLSNDEYARANMESAIDCLERAYPRHGFGENDVKELGERGLRYMLEKWIKESGDR